MNPASYRIRTDWAARAETTRACAIRMARMLTNLAALHSAFARWYEQAWTLEEAFVPLCKMPPQINELTEVFDKGRHFTDVSNELMADLGYSVGAWNGVDGPDGVSMSLGVGSYTEQRPFPNEVGITVHGLGALEPGSPDLINAKCLKAVLLTMIDAWEPSWANIADWDYGHKALSTTRILQPFRSGWMTYLSSPYARKVTPPLSAITESVDGGGILMLATNEVFTPDNPQHVAVADAIQACLEPLQSDPRLGAAP
jgi:hypothetical protein